MERREREENLDDLDLKAHMDPLANKERKDWLVSLV